MKFSYSIHPDRKLNVLRFSGAITIADITRSTEQLWADPLYDRTYNGIVNLQGVTTPRAGLEDIKALLAFYRHDKTSVGWWTAIFSEPKPTALALIFKAALTGPFRLEIVSTWEAACRFLEMDVPASFADAPAPR
jgi:hypothetical protein